jgi:hypothetical protein
MNGEVGTFIYRSSTLSDGSSNAVFFCSTQRQQVQQSRRLAAEKHGEPSSIEDNFKTRNAAEDEEEMRKEAKGVSRASTAPPTEAQIHFMVEFAKRLRDGIGVCFQIMDIGSCYICSCLRCRR